jgi:hypothetical protein
MMNKSQKNTTMNCRISKRGESYEGSVMIPGLGRTKLVRASDGTSLYSTRSGVQQAANSVAKRFNLSLDIEDKTSSSKSTSKKTSKSETTQPVDMNAGW